MGFEQNQSDLCSNPTLLKQKEHFIDVLKSLPACPACAGMAGRPLFLSTILRGAYTPLRLTRKSAYRSLILKKADREKPLC